MKKWILAAILILAVVFCVSCKHPYSPGGSVGTAANTAGVSGMV
jgi:hypothetical protein